MKRLWSLVLLLCLALAASAGAKEVVLTTDVLVIGGGGAGLCAAIEAADRGAEVIVLEKMPFLGGNTLISGQAMNVVNPKTQVPAGIEDSIELHFAQTLAAGDYRGNPELVRIMIEGAPAAYEWYERLGMIWEDTVFQIYGALYPRTHWPANIPPGRQGAFIRVLEKAARERNVQILLNTRATKLLRESPFAGRVYGARAVDKEGNDLVVLAKAVVLASGGFGANVEMRSKYDPRFGPDVGTTNHVGATGDGILMAQDIGADLVGMDYIQCIGVYGSPVSVIRPGLVLYINNKGERIVDEGGRRDAITDAVLAQEGQMAWVVADQHVLEVGEPGSGVLVADTLEELAEKMGVPAQAFVDTVTKYNSYVEQGFDPDFGKRALEAKLDSPPFYAGAARPAVHHTMGGGVINSKTQVIDRQGEVIPGLYAAGEVTGGIHGTNRVGGNALADMSVFGRIAGTNAAIEAIGE